MGDRITRRLWGTGCGPLDNNSGRPCCVRASVRVAIAHVHIVIHVHVVIHVHIVIHVRVRGTSSGTGRSANRSVSVNRSISVCIRIGRGITTRREYA